MKKGHVFVGVLICIMFTAAIVALFLVEPKPAAREPLLLLIGSLSAAFGAFVNYAFGSSAGSARKDELLANSSPANQIPTSVLTQTTSITEKP